MQISNKGLRIVQSDGRPRDKTIGTLAIAPAADKKFSNPGLHGG